MLYVFFPIYYARYMALIYCSLYFRSFVYIEILLQMEYIFRFKEKIP